MVKYGTAVKTNHKTLVLKQKNASHRRTHAMCVHMPCVQKNRQTSTTYGLGMYSHMVKVAQKSAGTIS